MKKTFILLILALALFIVGCSDTTFTSFVDPDFRDKTFNNLMIFAIVENLEIRSKCEKIIVEQFAAYKLKAVASIDIFPPTREVKSNDIPSILETYNIDGVLQINVTDANTKTQHYQGQTYTTGSASTIGSNTYFNTSTYTFPDYNVNTMNLSFNLKIVDSATAKTAWMASATSSGSDGLTRISIEELMSSLAESLVWKLHEDNLIPQPIEE